MAYHIYEIENITGTSFKKGNHISLLPGGKESFEFIFGCIEEALRIVCLEFYIFRNDETGRRLAEILKRKVSQGVKVYVLYDHFGSFGTPRSFWRDLRKYGVNVLASRPFKLFSISKYYHRDHRKLIVIDGARAFTGGFNIANEYGGFHLRRKSTWRDTGIFIEGPLASHVFDYFRKAWLFNKGDVIQVNIKSFPEFKDGVPAIPIFASSSRGRRMIRRLLCYSIDNAEKYIYLTTAYFVPGKRLLSSLIRAVKRGVDVRLLMPGKSDVPPAQYAGMAFYTRLLNEGVRIFHYNGMVLHAKSYLFDGYWSIVGSLNLDAQSLRWNDEGNVGILSQDFGRTLLALFDNDLKNSTEIKLNEWIRRPLCNIFKERIFFAMRERL